MEMMYADLPAAPKRLAGLTLSGLVAICITVLARLVPREKDHMPFTQFSLFSN